MSRLGTTRLILAGQVTEQCILYSALDAYVRHFDIRIAQDAGGAHRWRPRRGRVDHDAPKHAGRPPTGRAVPRLS